MLLLCSRIAGAQEAPPPQSAPAAATAPPPAETPPTQPAPKFKRWIVHLNFAFNVVTFLGSYGDGTGAKAEQVITPDKRIIVFQQLGIGYFFHKYFRVQFTVQFGETATNVPQGKSTMALLGFIPWVVMSYKGFVFGMGPMICAISANTVPRFDAGVFLGTGYVAKLPHNFGLGGLIQMAALFVDRTTVAVSPVITATYRF